MQAATPAEEIILSVMLTLPTSVINFKFIPRSEKNGIVNRHTAILTDGTRLSSQEMGYDI